MTGDHGESNVLYFYDDSNRIFKLDLTTGKYAAILGKQNKMGYSEGSLASASFVNGDCGGLYVDSVSHDLYFSDVNINRIRKVSSSSKTVTTVVGNDWSYLASDGTWAGEASICEPGGMGFDSSGNMIFAEACNHRIRQIDSSSGELKSLAGKGVVGAGGFSSDSVHKGSATLSAPYGVVVESWDSRAVLFSDVESNRVRKMYNPFRGRSASPSRAPERIEPVSQDCSAGVVATADAMAAIIRVERFVSPMVELNIIRYASPWIWIEKLF
jgi:hypothetical protein